MGRASEKLRTATHETGETLGEYLARMALANMIDRLKKEPHIMSNPWDGHRWSARPGDVVEDAVFVEIERRAEP